MEKKLTWNQILRFRLLEIVLQWEGRLTTNHLCNAFDIGRQQASRDINRYIRDYCPKGIEYDARLKGYKTKEFFSPRFSEGKVDEYLALLHQEKQFERQSHDPLIVLPLMGLGYGHIEILDVPSRRIDPLIVRKLVQAARDRLRVDVEYVSLSSGELSGRNIIPHTLIYDGIRWHVRAFCEKKGEYLDFVMSRFRGVPELLDSSRYGREEDLEWNKNVTAIVVPNPSLSSVQKDIIANDYAMDEGKLLICQRIPLMHYALERLQVSYGGDHDENPMQHLLVLKNRKELISQGCSFKLTSADLPKA
ncbi:MULTISPECIES: helix-turn-helix transcriptional regulator [Pantoea]|uniref:helix-turn-helix transcriptional regulator n=1 Tax=Pantoea TaxID=53335 RepID=UPI00091DBE45|nr:MULTISPECIES: WYL domain-containing protein [Pantoea]MCS4494607.1 WYL domain-containing protein [Pantoea sp. B623]MDJ0033257.1 WYL domain-containing protein [Pantoea ananatis]MDJ0046148.1 WYL domain-containing protein [Pantoea ananatis]REF07457.1 putative DNA-binding transcriptional regulator YafY [Pantoea ananatis]SFX75290.1 Predicted DNA-binding transcriptional regulator YafY, contains an HTH and WYL domains [Pantoea ananatis]